MSSCPHCAFANLPNASFCANCGRELARPLVTEKKTTQAERRFVTMLFADLSGFTSLSETMDPETVRDIINLCFDRLVPIIETHQGVVDQFVGDALVALFGAPVAHEDDPAQACRAALAMMDALAEVNRERGLDLGLHIGINSGTVVSGGIGSRGRQQYSVLGDAVNLASRLEDAAERGEIFVGAETERLTREQFEYVSRGEMPFKGKSEPQPVFQLIGTREAARTHRPIHTLTPMFGRARELALLERATRELQDEAGLRVISILGEAGLGKSRLLQEWRETISDNDASHFIVASCAPDGSLHAYALVADLARALTPLQTEQTNNAALTLLMGLTGSAQENVAQEMDATALQAQYVNALRDLFKPAISGRPLILVCEDMHWADAPSCQVLQRVIAGLTTARVLLCVTARPDRETAGWEFLEHIQESPGAAATQMYLAPLSEQDAQAMVSDIADGTVPPEINSLVLEHAEGNPLFVEELMRMLIERGDLKRQGEQWILTRELTALDVPNTLQGVLMARVDQLPPNARYLLQITAVLGREAPLEILERVAEALR